MRCGLQTGLQASAVICALVLLLGPTGRADAQSGVFYEKDGWTGHAARSDEGEFQGCNASSVLDEITAFGGQKTSSWRLGFAQFSSGTWTIILSHEGKPFQPGLQYQVTLSVDGQVIYGGESRVMDNGVAFLVPALSAAAVAALRNGSQLEYATQRGRMMFNLSGSADAIDAVRECVERNTGSWAIARSESRFDSLETQGRPCAVTPPNDDRRDLPSLNIRQGPYEQILGAVRFGTTVYRVRGAPSRRDRNQRLWELVYMVRDGRLVPFGYAFLDYLDYLDCRPGAAEAAQRSAEQIVERLISELLAEHPDAHEFSELIGEELGRAVERFPGVDFRDQLAFAYTAAKARHAGLNRAGIRQGVFAGPVPCTRGAEPPPPRQVLWLPHRSPHTRDVTF